MDIQFTSEMKVLETIAFFADMFYMVKGRDAGYYE